MDKDIIGDALDIGLESEAVVVMPKSPVVRSDDVPNPTMNDIVSDFSYARHNIHNAMEKSGSFARIGNDCGSGIRRLSTFY